MCRNCKWRSKNEVFPSPYFSGALKGDKHRHQKTQLLCNPCKTAAQTDVASMPTYAHTCIPVIARLRMHSALISLSAWSSNSQHFSSFYALFGGKMGGHVVPRFCNLDLVSFATTCVFLNMGKVKQSCEDHAIG